MNGLQFHLNLTYFGNDIVPSAFPEQLVQKMFLPRRQDEKWDIFHFNRKLGLAINCSGQIVDMDGMGRGHPEHRTYMRVSSTGHSISVG